MSSIDLVCCNGYFIESMAFTTPFARIYISSSWMSNEWYISFVKFCYFIMIFNQSNWLSINNCKREVFMNYNLERSTFCNPPWIFYCCLKLYFINEFTYDSSYCVFVCHFFEMCIVLNFYLTWLMSILFFKFQKSFILVNQVQHFCMQGKLAIE